MILLNMIAVEISNKNQSHVIITLCVGVVVSI